MSFLRSKKFWFILGVIVVIGFLGIYFRGGKEQAEYSFTKVQKGNILQTVSVTGSVKAEPTIRLRFQKIGKIDQILVEVGELVKKDQVLAKLESEALAIAVNQAQADLRLAEAKLAQLKAGNTAEEINLAEAKVRQAEVDLDTSETNLENQVALNQDVLDEAVLAVKLKEDALVAVETAFENAEKALENVQSSYSQDVESAYDNAYSVLEDVLVSAQDSLTQADNILGVDNEEVNDSFEVNLKANNHTRFSAAQAEYSDVKMVHLVFKKSVEATMVETIIHEEIDSLLVEAESVLQAMDEVLDQTYTILSDARIFGSLTQTNLNTKKTTINSEQTSNATVLDSVKASVQAIEDAGLSETSQVDTAQAAYDTAESNLKAAQIALEQAQQNQTGIDNEIEANLDTYRQKVAVAEAALAAVEASLAVAEALPRSVDLASFEAEVMRGRANLNLANYNLSQTYLKAPAEGVITVIDGEIGENVEVTHDFMTLIAHYYEIEANVSETDIVKVKVGDKVRMTLDAFGLEREFAGEIMGIDPAETVVSGVIYYRISSVFTAEEEGVKPGMTANLDIVTAEKEGILIVPRRAVKYDGTPYVEVVGAEGAEKVVVEVGLEGDQEVEVVSGLKEGDEVITFVK